MSVVPVAFMAPIFFLRSFASASSRRVEGRSTSAFESNTTTAMRSSGASEADEREARGAGIGDRLALHRARRVDEQREIHRRARRGCCACGPRARCARPSRPRHWPSRTCCRARRRGRRRGPRARAAPWRNVRTPGDTAARVVKRTQLNLRRMHASLGVRGLRMRGRIDLRERQIRARARARGDETRARLLLERSFRGGFRRRCRRGRTSRLYGLRHSGMSSRSGPRRCRRHRLSPRSGPECTRRSRSRDLAGGSRRRSCRSPCP